jgi:hypothetical protein
MEDIQSLIQDSGLLQLVTKTTLSGSKNKLRIKELTTKTFKTSYQLLHQLKTTLNQVLELIVTETVILLLTKTQLDLLVKELQLISPTFKPMLRLRRMKKMMTVKMRKKKSEHI